MRALVVLPTYNEAENVVPLVRDVLAQDERIEVLVVDDNSPDGTGDLVEAMRRDQPRLHLLRRAGKLGLGTAYLAGFRFGLDRDYDHILTMDCDYSHHPRYLPHLLAVAREVDLVIGSRYVQGGGIANWPWQRRVLSRFANRYTRMLLRVPVRDCTAGFRCYGREVLEAIDPFSVRASGYSFLEEMVWRVHHAGFRIREIPIVFEDRRFGFTKIDPSEIYRAAWHVLITAFRRPRGRRAARAAATPARRSTADPRPPPRACRPRGTGSARTPRRARRR
jgi:dolichol-phosphate mannosyltransferase